MALLENKTAVVTGAGSGIGAAIAKAYAQAGAQVVVHYHHSEKQAEQVARQINADGGGATVIRANITHLEEINFLIREAKAALGQIDIWVNNAGADILTGKGAKLTDQEKLQNLIATDLKGTINCCWGVVPLMQAAGRGVIVNMSWDLAIPGFPGRDAQMFSAVKAGISGFSRSLAKTVAPTVRVNVLAPGWIETDFAKAVMATDYYRQRVNEIPMKRFGKPVDVASAALYLASDKAAYVTGQVININGGLS